jgi:hypothetical protein
MTTISAIVAERDALRSAIDAALATTWEADGSGGWGTADDTLFSDRLTALAALQPHWQGWGDVAWCAAGREVARRQAAVHLLEQAARSEVQAFKRGVQFREATNAPLPDDEEIAVKVRS